MVAWGYNSSGQLGSTGVSEFSSVPVAVNKIEVLAGKPVIAVSSGFRHNLAICSDGAAVAWGYGSRGELGNSTFTASSNLVAVSTTGELYGKKIMAVAAGLQSLAVAAEPTNGYLAWSSGQVGLPDKTESADPDRDGIPNLLEYILHGNPQSPSQAILPVLSPDAGAFIFKFTRLASSSSDTTQVFQYSTDMSQWTDISITGPTDANVQLGSLDAEGNQLVTVAVPKNANPQMFGRLKAR
jgi:hypothetical protein